MLFLFSAAVAVDLGPAQKNNERDRSPERSRGSCQLFNEKVFHAPRLAFNNMTKKGKKGVESDDSGGAFGRARVSNTRPWLQSASLKRLIVASYYYLTDVRFLFFKNPFFPPNSVPTPKMEAQGQKSQEPRSGGYIRRLQKKSYGVDRGGLVELGAAMAP